MTALGILYTSCIEYCVYSVLPTGYCAVFFGFKITSGKLRREFSHKDLF